MTQIDYERIGKVYAQKLKVNSQGYTANGTYYGRGGLYTCTVYSKAGKHMYSNVIPATSFLHARQRIRMEILGNLYSL